MRKFFKSLAVLLALVLIVGVIPAAAADSLSMQKEKVLYLDGSKGAKEDGTKCKTSYKKLVANMIKGFDKDTMSVVLSSADKDIVKTSKAGRIFAKSLGTTTVNVKVYDAAETLLFNESLKVIVKKNATDATFKVEDIAAGDTFKVGQKITVRLPRKGIDTDQRSFVSGDETIATVKEQADSKRVYDVQFLKAGEVTFTASAYQSTKYPYPTAKQEIKVTVTNPAPVDAKILASDSIELTFDEDVEAAGLFKDAKEIPYDAIYYNANSTTPVYINAVKAVKATGNKVKVDLFSALSKDVTYYIELNGAKLEVVLTKSGSKDVKTVAITTTYAVKDVAKNIDYILYNEDGIDITTSALAEGGKVSFTQTDYNAEITEKTANKYEILMWTKDAKATLTAKYSYLDSNDNYKEYSATGNGVITCVEESPYIFKKTVWTLNDGTAIDASATNLKKYLSIGEKFKLSGVAVFSQDGKDNSVVFGRTSVATESEQLKVWFPDNNYAMFDENNDVVGNKAGTATAFVGYTKSGANKVLDVITIEVRDVRKQSRVELSIKNGKTGLNGLDAVDDEITFEVKLLDQYNDPINVAAGKSIVLNQIEDSKQYCLFSGPTTFSGVVPAETGKYTLTVDSDDFAAVTKAQNVGFFVKYDNSISSNNVFFTVNDQAAASGSVAFTADIKSLDTSVFDFVSKKSEDKKATLQISTSSYGVFTGNVDVSGQAGFLTKTNSHTATASAGSFQLEILKNGSKIDVTTTDYNLFIDTTTDLDEGKIYVYNFINDSGVIKKLAAGSYSFRLFEYDANGRVKNPQIIDIVVTDNQIKPVYKQEAQKTNVNTNYGVDCFSYTFDGKAIFRLDDNGVTTRPITYDNNYNASSVYVKKATISISVQLKSDDSYGDFAIEVPIGTTITK